MAHPERDGFDSQAVTPEPVLEQESQCFRVFGCWVKPDHWKAAFVLYITLAISVLPFRILPLFALRDITSAIGMFL